MRVTGCSRTTGLTLRGMSKTTLSCTGLCLEYVWTGWQLWLMGRIVIGRGQLVMLLDWGWSLAQVICRGFGDRGSELGSGVRPANAVTGLWSVGRQ